MSVATGFPLFDPNAIQHNSNQRSAERFTNSCLDPDARERLAAMYRENESMEDARADGQQGDSADVQASADAAKAAPEGLDSLLSRASAEAAAQSAEVPAGESVAESNEASPEDLVAEALAAVTAGNGAAIQSPAEAEADVRELVHEIRQEQSLNEIAEVAETFVAEQTGEAAVVSDVPVEPTCGAAAEVETVAEVEAVAPVEASAQPLEVPAFPEASLASDVPWEPIAEAAKKFDLEQSAPEATEVAVAPAVEVPAPEPVKAAAPAITERRRKRRALISAPLRVRTKNL